MLLPERRYGAKQAPELKIGMGGRTTSSSSVLAVFWLWKIARKKSRNKLFAKIDAQTCIIQNVQNFFFDSVSSESIFRRDSISVSFVSMGIWYQFRYWTLRPTVKNRADHRETSRSILRARPNLKSAGTRLTTTCGTARSSAITSATKNTGN